MDILRKGLNAKIKTINRYLTILYNMQGNVDFTDIFRVVSPEMRQHVEIANLPINVPKGQELIEFVRPKVMDIREENTFHSEEELKRSS